MIMRGVSKLWGNVNHIALVVRDIGRSLHFYTDIIGMQQVLRPDFDRCGRKLFAIWLFLSRKCLFNVFWSKKVKISLFLAGTVHGWPLAMLICIWSKALLPFTMMTTWLSLTSPSPSPIWTSSGRSWPNWKSNRGRMWACQIRPLRSLLIRPLLETLMDITLNFATATVLSSTCMAFKRPSRNSYSS